MSTVVLVLPISTAPVFTLVSVLVTTVVTVLPVLPVSVLIFLTSDVFTLFLFD